MLFKDIKIGHWFESDGNKWLKVSSRTARLNGSKLRWFYFRQNERASSYKTSIIDSMNYIN